MVPIFVKPDKPINVTTRKPVTAIVSNVLFVGIF
jgi:hypothetical protein